MTQDVNGKVSINGSIIQIFTSLTLIVFIFTTIFQVNL